MNLLVCLGGTGQLVLHYYLQWHLLGLEADAGPLRALVVDQDELMGSVRFAAKLFERLTERDRTAAGEAAPWVRQARLDVTDERSQLDSLFCGDARTDPRHPAKAFLDSATLAQQVAEGLYGRPCLAPTLWPRHGDSIRKELDKACQECAVPGQPLRIVVVGSVIGGAGGGLLLPVLRHLLGHASVQVSVVLFERYFTANTLDRALADRQKANAAGVTATLLQQLQGTRFELRAYLLLTGSRPRDEQSERQAVHLAWPDPSDPLAEACAAIHAMWREAVAENPVEPTDFVMQPTSVRALWSKAEEAQRRALAALTVLLGEGAIEKMAHDPAAAQIWGRRLPDTLEQFWKAWARSRPSERDAFPALVARQLAGWFAGEPYSVNKLFPPADSRHGAEDLRRLSAGLPEVKHAGAPPRLPEWAALHVVCGLLKGAAA